MGPDLGNGAPSAFAIVANACRAAATGRPSIRYPIHLPPPNGDAIVAMAERHRISAQVLRLLARYPGLDHAAAIKLSDMAQQRQLSALRLSSVTGAVSQALSGAGVRHLVLKGPALSHRLYGDLAARDCKDIDIVIDPDARLAAEAVIAELGFGRADGTTAPPPDRWRRAVGPKDVSFRSRDRSIELELHDRLFDNTRLMPRSFDQYWDDRDTRVVAGTALPLLSATDEFLYLCGHGAACAWFRLKWLQDIARIIATSPPEALEGFADTARQRGVWPMVLSAAILVEEIFDLPAGDAIAGARSRGVARIVDEAHRALAAPAPASTSPSPSIAQLWRLLALQLGLRNDWRYRRAVIARALVSQNDLDTVKLPGWASWLYYPLRPILFAWRRLRRREG